MPPESRVRCGRVLRSLLLVLAGTTALAGCPNPIKPPDDGMSAMPGPPMQFSKEELVAHINSNIHKLHGWRSTDLKIKVKQPGMIELPVSAFIAVESSRNFRLKAKSLLRGDEADFGSNDEHFWFWMRDSPQRTIFMARHENVHLVQERMHIPFDPDWLMEALGVVPIDASLVELRHTDDRPREEGQVVDLFETRILANGHRVTLATTVRARDGVVIGRTLFDPQSNIVARATILGHRVHEPDGPEGGIVMPHVVKLEWPQAQTMLTLEIGQIEVNPAIPVAIWTMPEIPGTKVLVLGEEKRTASLPIERRPIAAGQQGARPLAPLGASSRIDGPREPFEPSLTRPVSFESPQSTPLGDWDDAPPGFDSGSPREEPTWEFEN